MKKWEIKPRVWLKLLQLFSFAMIAFHAIKYYPHHRDWWQLAADIGTGLIVFFLGGVAELMKIQQRNRDRANESKLRRLLDPDIHR